MIHFKHAFGLSLLTALSLIGIGFSSWYVYGGNNQSASFVAQGGAVMADDVKAANTFGISFNAKNNDPGSYCFDYYTYTSGGVTTHYFPEVYLSIHYLVNRQILSGIPYSEDTESQTIDCLKMGLHYYADKDSDILQYFQSSSKPSQAILSLDVANSYQIRLDIPSYQKTLNSGLYDYNLETSVPIKCYGEDSLYNLIQNDYLSSETAIPVTLTFPFTNVDDAGLYEVLTRSGDYAFSNSDTKFDYYLGITTK